MPGDSESRHRVDGGDVERLVERQRRQDPRQPPRHHRLAGARRADEQRVVAAGGGNLQRPARQRAGRARPRNQASYSRRRRRRGALATAGTNAGRIVQRLHRLA